VTRGQQRVRGFPTSSNGASSFHLEWQDVPVCMAVEVTLTVETLPTVNRLFFWALQASFTDGRRRTGGAHLGLQWNPKYPDGRAVNWGGYHEGGPVLDGTESPLRSSTGDRNTRDLWWEPGRAYRLRIEPAAPEWWAGTIEDDHGNVVEVRRLHGGGTHLERPVVWSEVFARCDDPSVSVRWSDPIYEVDGVRTSPSRYRVNYQPVSRGGCTNTTSLVVEGGVRQVTNCERITRHNAFIATG
jgi:hypothetical protein